jgi:hypothetical protein
MRSGLGAPCQKREVITKLIEHLNQAERYVMQEWTESELNWYLERLATNNIQDVARTLFVVAQIGREPQPQPVPTGNAQVITYLEQLAEDDRWCVVDWRIPYAFGELRWLAARLLACEYAYQGIEKPIILKDVIQPIRQVEIGRIVQYYNLTMTFDELMQQGLVPRKTEIIKPQDYAACCSKEAVEARRRNQDKKE